MKVSLLVVLHLVAIALTASGAVKWWAGLVFFLAGFLIAGTSTGASINHILAAALEGFG